MFFSPPPGPDTPNTRPCLTLGKFVPRDSVYLTPDNQAGISHTAAAVPGNVYLIHC